MLGLQFHEKTAFWAVTAMRSSFDFITGYGPGRMDECKWLQRIVFLETVAGVPGMVGGMVSAAWPDLEMMTWWLDSPAAQSMKGIPASWAQRPCPAKCSRRCITHAGENGDVR